MGSPALHELDDQRLRIFSTIVDAGNYAQAAITLGLPRSAATDCVRTLEKSLHCNLLLRQQGRLTPTAAGRQLYELAQRVLLGIEGTKQSIHALTAGDVLAVGALGSMGNYVLAPLLGKFLRSAHGAQVRFRTGTQENLLRWLQTGYVSLAFGLYQAAPKGVVSREWADEDIVFFVSATHPLAGRETVALADISHFGLATGVRSESRLAEAIVADLRTHALPVLVQRQVEIGSPEALRAVVSQGDLIGILPYTAVAGDLSRGSVREIKIDGVSLTVRYCEYAANDRPPGMLSMRFTAFLLAALSDSDATRSKRLRLL